MSTNLDLCPACYSPNVWIGNFVLSCVECGWHYLNKYPCSECGQPSVSMMYFGRKGDYIECFGCPKHPIL